MKARGVLAEMAALWPAMKPVALVFVGSVAVVVLPDGLLPVPLRLTAALVIAGLLGYVVGGLIVPHPVGVAARLALTMAAALALPVAVGLVLTITPVGLGRTQLAVSAVLVATGAWLVAARRQTPLARLTGPLPSRPAGGTRVLGLYLLAVLGVGVAFGLRLTATQPGDAPFTELWADAGTVGDGRPTVHTVNHEGEVVLYRVELRLDGVLRATQTSVVADGDTWIYAPALIVSEGERLDVRLYRSANLASAYRQVVVTVGLDW